MSTAQQAKAARRKARKDPRYLSHKKVKKAVAYPFKIKSVAGRRR